MRAFVVVLIASACNRTTPATPDIAGSLSIHGVDVSSTMKCQPGAAVHIFVDIVTPEGTLRFEDQKLRLDGEELRCDKLDRSWNGTRRPDGTAYWRGTLAFDCSKRAASGSTEPGAIKGDLQLACGGITLEERAQLDRAQRDLDAQKRRNANQGAETTNAANQGSAAPGSNGSAGSN
ncbi:MAG: hypothetical protein ACKV2T_29880 [Kofleriaceae bacterium]